jgi:predicted MPP superfamily phosphohydrolase
MKAQLLLEESAKFYDDPSNGLASAARKVRGFEGGGRWMVRAMGVMRGKDVRCGDCSFAALGYVKYFSAGLAGLVVVAVSANIGLFWIGVVAGGLAFYMVEVQFAFVFPLAIDGDRRVWRQSATMISRVTTPAAMAVILPLAATMLFGGILGRGFVRSWSLGCLAVLIWYEEQRIAGRRVSVREERVGGGAVNLKLMWITDIHLGGAGGLDTAARVLRTAKEIRPDIIVIGGDMVETQKKIPLLGRLVKGLVRIAETHVLPGNHDRWVGLDAIEKSITGAGAKWHPHPGFVLSGKKARRLSAVSPGDLVFVHNPSCLNLIEVRWKVAFAGHLHGGQVVLWRRGGREYPGAFLSEWNGPLIDSSKGPVIVSRGVHDTLPIRWNCPREVVLCNLS